MSQSGKEQAQIHQHSGWLIPLGLVVVTLVLCGLVLLYDLRPGTGLFRNNSPTADISSVSLSVRGVRFEVPANYLESRSVRRGGDVDVITLSALLPDMRGFSAADAALFVGNAADSTLVHLLVRGDTNGLSAADRLSRIYMPYISNPAGTQDSFDLTRYSFRSGTGYDLSDLYAGTTDSGLLLMLCERPAQDLPSPNCLAIDHPVATGVNLSYRFKRAQLSHWREIATGVNGLMKKLTRH